MSSIHQAVNTLGTETIRSLVLIYGIFNKYENDSGLSTVIGPLSRQALQCANLARTIAEREKFDQANLNHAFTAGLLHDIGQLVLAINHHAQHEKIWEEPGADSKSRLQMELDLFQTSHAKVGAYLLNIWRLPDPVIESVAYHHTPDEAPDDSFSILTVVHAAQALIEDDGNVDQTYLQRLDVSSKLPIWTDIYNELCTPLEST